MKQPLMSTKAIPLAQSRTPVREQQQLVTMMMAESARHRQQELKKKLIRLLDEWDVPNVKSCLHRDAALPLLDQVHRLDPVPGPDWKKHLSVLG